MLANNELQELTLDSDKIFDIMKIESWSFIVFMR